MRTSQEKLLIALREIEEGGKPLSREDLLTALEQKTGYKAGALKAYLSKNLQGVLVHETGTRYEVRGAGDFDEDLFEVLMGQNNLLKEAAQNRLRWEQVRAKFDQLGEWLARRDRRQGSPAG